MPEGEPLEHQAAGRPSERSAEQAGRGAMAGVGVLLATAVLLVFGRTLRHDFLNYDDDQYFYANPQVQHGLTWSGVTWALQATDAANWHPLTWLSLMLDVQLFGVSPAGPHLTNVLLHAANTVLLFLLLKRLADRRSDKSAGAKATQAGALWPSAMVAALFGLHPLHVESVAWVAERKDVLSGLFFMLTLLFYARFAQATGLRTGTLEAKPGNNGSGDYWLALLFFALGLMRKPMLVTLPFVLLLLDYWPLARFTIHDSRFAIRRLAWEKLPFFVLSGISCVVTLIAQQQAIEPIEWLPLSQRVSNALVSYIAYLGKTFYPAKLAIFYPHAEEGQPLLQIALALILLAGISAGVLALRQMRPCLLVGWLWYLGMLVPVIGLVQVGEQARADRYTYLPIIGVFIMLAWSTGEVFERWRYRCRVLGAGAFTVIAALMLCASIQTSYWRNSESLWTHTLACTSRNYVGHNNLGIVLAKRGQSVEAMEHCQMALEIKPGYMDAHNNFGIILAGQGRAAEAMEHFQKALEIKPDFAEAHYNLGNLLAKQGRSAEAMEHFLQALAIKPDSAKVHYRLALALKDQGRFEAAIPHFQKVLELEPRPMLAQNSLAWLFATCPEASLRNGDGAVELAQQAAQLSGGRHPEILDTLAAAYAEARRFPEAVETAQRALDLSLVQDNKPLANDIRTRLKLYEANSPYREKP
jgi:protein O-mannosyl-transferase